MSNYRFILSVFICLLLSFAGNAQDIPASPYTSIMEMKNNGVLLVRLHTKKFGIDRLRTMGKNELADTYQQEQDDLNKSIINAFNSGFSFCPVLFFYSYDSRAVFDEDFQSVTFLNADLQPTREGVEMLQDRTIFIGEFGNISENRVGIEDVSSAELTAKKLNFSALVFSNAKFKTLPKPFPYYTRWFQGTVFERAPIIVVSKANEKLVNFLMKAR